MSSAPRAGTRASKSTPSSGGASGGGRAQAKMDSLLAFLDEVETDTRVASSVVATPRDLERMSTASSHLGPSASMVGAGDDMGMAGMPPTVPLEPDTASRAGAVYDGVKARLMELTLENKDKSRTIAILKRQVGELREEQKRSSEASAQQLRDKLAKQKKKFEAEMARQLAFIDSLIADKEQLSKQCEALGDDVKAMEARMEARMKALAEQHAAELRRARDHWAAAEKVRREKWEAEKTREVKEMTIKGLEPEIQRILDKHREEKERLQRQQKDELARLRADCQQQLEQEVAAAREDARRQARELLDAERQQLRSAAATDAQGFSEQLRRVREEADQELQAQRQRAREALEEARRTHREEVERVQAGAEAARQGAEQRQAAVVEQLKARHAVELQAASRAAGTEQDEWRRRVAAKWQAEAAEREAALRAQLARERDEEIEAVITRVNEEAVALRRKVEARARQKQAEVTEECERRLGELQRAAEEWKSKYAALAARQQGSDKSLHEREAALQRAQSEAAAAAHEATQLRQEVARGKAEAQAAEARWEEQLRAREREAERGSAELRAAAARAEEEAQRAVEEVERMREEQEARLEAEVAALHSRVREAVAHKDSLVRQLQEQLATAQLRIQQTEQLLERQREELLS